ncbi:tRNA/rRNA cytosine-C5-methylase RsmB [Shewanella sp. NFH-SH190041]|uniref:RsmB/NOP family class I SAM-dependent RNA methyltransferase n=1 Tax=Shewanella sp. NFH-SH190041 TaxID=2950245 RepID=UPI0021C44BDF|nr:RsmB/NOP family class I SAM-dependent RNA methyltransferase [Shewanella sp. NFH-SH190041]BDM65357.1 tRNA/rRNA cytosine-C5-methylase RsmB [Shewanella sp. NFH-SH190041]
MAKSHSFTAGFDAGTLSVSSPAQKRALSYASTLHQLVSDIFNSGMPADRTLANYFREHKKHGSKDRRLLRETLFALFRWWGWLQQIQQTANPQPWLAMLATAGHIERHQWQDIIAAWQELSGLTPTTEQRQATEMDGLSAQHAFNQCFPTLQVTLAQLAPQWFWQHCHCDDTAALAQVLSTRPPIWARVQGISREKALAELQALGIDASPAPAFKDALSLGHKSMNLNEVKLYQQGKLEIQDLASQVIGQICQPQPGQTWWDCCAGAGGKSLQLSSLMEDKGDITASDIRPQALTELVKRAKRAGIKHIRTALWQSDDLPVAAQAFDAVLVDAPCSCTGTWRRNPDMRWLDDASAVTDKPALQLDILSRASQAVKSGGDLVYATCSLAEAENGAVVDAFLAAHPEFEAVTIRHPFTGQECQHLTVWPQDADSDGMFVSKMRRK